MTKVYYDNDANLEILNGKTIAVIGYGIQGHAQAQNMRDSGLNVIIGLRDKNSKSYKLAESHGFKPLSIADAAKKGDFIFMLIPDEVQKEVYEKYIKQNLKKGKTLVFSHGFNIRFGRIVPPEGVDVIMVAPKGPGAMVRQAYLDGFGVPTLIAVEKDYSGNAKEHALALAKAQGATRAGVIETTFAEETETDLFGEQVDLCGGVTELIKSSFQILVEAGYQPEIAYFETLHELKLIVDLIQKGGIYNMWVNVSNTAKYGGLTRGKRIINENTREEMRKILKEIQSGEFAKEWMNEYDNNKMKNLEKMKEEERNLQIEKVGDNLRKMFKKKE